MDARNDVWNLADESAWTDDTSAQTGATCGADCTASSSCVMYRWALQGTDRTCQLFYEDTTYGDKLLGFKVGQGDDYVTYRILDSQSVGVVISTLNGLDEAACLAACNQNARCEVYMLSIAGVCQLAESELDVDYTSMFSVKGDHLYSDRQL